MSDVVTERILQERDTGLTQFLGQTFTSAVLKTDDEGIGFYRLGFKRPDSDMESEITIYLKKGKKSE